MTGAQPPDARATATFWEHQDQARNLTRRFLFLTFLSAVMICGGVGLVVFAYTGELLFGLLAGGFIGLVIFIRGAFVRASLVGGGACVAEALGGEPVCRETATGQVRVLLNVVDEMAIASGVPTPQVYILEDQALNAFAAGYDTEDAVIGVTRGLLDALDRDQLQGVIAHEFSHILNGDMRLNMNMTAYLAGLLALITVGRVIMPRRSRKGSAQVVMIALVLMIVGAIGAFFARWLQSLVSRQREYLADASAVQFTRYPAGIGSALQLLSGGVSSLDAGNADDYAHFYIADGASGFGSFFSGFFPTHPPIEERIRRVGGPFDYVPRQSTPAEVPMASEVSEPAVASPFDAFTGTPLGAVTAIYGGLAAAGGIAPFQEVLGDKNPAIGAQLQAMLPQLEAMTPLARLDLVDRCHGQLSQLSEAQAREVLEVINGAICADGRVDLDELALLFVLRRRLGKIAGRHGVVAKGGAVDEDLHILLSAMAHAAGAGEVARAYGAGRDRLGPVQIGAGPLGEEQVGPEILLRSLERLQSMSPKLKSRVGEAVMAAAEADGHWTEDETLLVRAVLAALELPNPFAQSLSAALNAEASPQP